MYQIKSPAVDLSTKIDWLQRFAVYYDIKSVGVILDQLRRCIKSSKIVEQLDAKKVVSEHNNSETGNYLIYELEKNSFNKAKIIIPTYFKTLGCFSYLYETHEQRNIFLLV